MKKALTLLVFILLTLVSFSQNQSDSEPKVGLVLSGGGAKGLAHIGALKVIDSLGIKVDYVAGTSMGAIIGSLYASGYSGHQLDSIFQEVDFDKLIGDEIPRASKTFYERDNSEKYALTLPFDDFKIQLPSAISRGQNIYNLFSRLMLHVSDVEDFSQLPIPFFCIATNIETGEKVILDSGSLPQTAAASGALPSLFQPIYIDGNMLIDGGVVDNYPIHDLRAKGMDIIIGVDVQDDLASREELKSAPEILLQINNFRTINDMKDKSKETDIYIKPDIKDFTVVSFDKGYKIIKNGQIAALEKLSELSQLKKYQKKREFASSRSPDSIKIQKIRIKGDTKYSRSYIKGKLKIRTNENLSYKDFQNGVNNLVATNNFESFIYKFKPLPEGYELLVELRENKNKTFLKFGVHYDNLYKSAALINITKKRILFNNDVASLDFGLGDNVRYNFEYFIDKGFYWSVGVNSRYNSFHKSVNANLLSDQITGVTGLNKIDAELSDFTNQIYVQTLFRRDFSLKLGAEHKRLKLSSETIDNQIDEDETIFDKSDYFSVFGELKFDTYDNKYFPSKGFYFDGDFQLFLSSSDYNNDFSQFSYAKANIGYVFSPLRKLSVRLGSEGGFKIGDDSNTSLSFALGGYGNKPINNLISFYGYDHISLTGNSFVKGSIDFDYEFTKKHHITLGANYSNIGAHIFEDGEWLTAPDYSGYALGYGLETFIGPIEIKYTWSPETKKNHVFFSVGYWF